MSHDVKINGKWHSSAGYTVNTYAPIGAIFPFGGTSAPSGYLFCDGSAVSRSDYSALFAVIGTSFGSGDGTATFNVPDLRESVPKGIGLTGNSANHLNANGLTLGEFIDDRVQEHTHEVPIPYYGGSGTGGVPSTARGRTATGSNTGRSGATTEVKAVGVNYIIKAKDVNLSGGTQTLADRVEALETLSQITVAVPNGGVKLAKYGRIVQASFQIVGDNLADKFTSGIWTNYGSSGVIPEIYRPLNTVYCGGLMVVSSPILMRVATNGNLGYYYTGGNLGYEYEWSQSWISAT